MDNFIRVTARAIADIGNLVKLVPAGGQTKTVASAKQYGGFVNEDWKKVGLDMKRDLIAYGRGKV